MGSRLEVPSHRGVFAAFNPRNMDVTLGAAAVARCDHSLDNGQLVSHAPEIRSFRKKSPNSCTVGLAKIFGEKSAKPHGGNWVKT